MDASGWKQWQMSYVASILQFLVGYWSNHDSNAAVTMLKNFNKIMLSYLPWHLLPQTSWLSLVFPHCLHCCLPPCCCLLLHQNHLSFHLQVLHPPLWMCTIDGHLTHISGGWNAFSIAVAICHVDVGLIRRYNKLVSGSVIFFYQEQHRHWPFSFLFFYCYQLQLFGDLLTWMEAVGVLPDWLEN